jgi:hypothetical protein
MFLCLQHNLQVSHYLNEKKAIQPYWLLQLSQAWIIVKTWYNHTAW